MRKAKEMKELRKVCGNELVDEGRLARLLLFYFPERLVASPNLSVRNDFPHIHTSHLWHGDWLICESQPNPVPTPLLYPT
jgi:hypothetical protein